MRAAAGRAANASIRWVADNPVSILGTPVGRSWYGSDLRKKLRAGSPTKAQHEAEKRLGVETSGHKWNP